VEQTETAFDAAWSCADAIQGWLTRDQAWALFDAAGALSPGSTVVEIGSHRGRSTVVLAAGLSHPSRLVAVDPFDAAWRYGGPDTRGRLMTNLAAAGVSDRVEVVATKSRDARTSWDGAVDLVYVDGKHDYWTVRDDLRSPPWESRWRCCAPWRCTGGWPTPGGSVPWPGSRYAGRRSRIDSVPCASCRGGSATSWSRGCSASTSGRWRACSGTKTPPTRTDRRHLTWRTRSWEGGRRW
jgi:Methyltransferase domain